MKQAVSCRVPSACLATELRQYSLQRLGQRGGLQKVEEGFWK